MRRECVCPSQPPQLPFDVQTRATPLSHCSRLSITSHFDQAWSRNRPLRASPHGPTLGIQLLCNIGRCMVTIPGRQVPPVQRGGIWMALDLKELHQYLREQLQHTIKQYECHSEGCRLPIPNFQVSDLVWLNSRNIRTRRPSKKLDCRHLGPFPILEKISSHTVRLGLPLALQRIHPVFHVSLLQPTNPSIIPNRIEDPPPLELDDDEEYEDQRILDSKVDQHRQGSGLLYLVEWKGFDNTSESTSWEPEENIWNAPDLVRAFHEAYPAKPKPL